MENREMLGEVVQAFFEEFHPENEIQVVKEENSEGKLVRLKLNVEKDDIFRMIQAIVNGNIIFLQYGNFGNLESGTVLEEQQAVIVEQEEQEGKVEQEEQVKQHNATSNLKRCSCNEGSNYQLEELMKLLEPAQSIEQAIETITNWLDLKKPKVVCSDFLRVGIYLGEFQTLEEVNQKLLCRYARNDLTYCAQATKKSLHRHGIHLNFLDFINLIADSAIIKSLKEKEQEIVRKEETSLKVKQVPEEPDAELEVEQIPEEAPSVEPDAEQIPKEAPSVELEVEQSTKSWKEQFETLMGEIDKAKTKEERVEAVLEKMGIKSNHNLIQTGWIRQIATTAIRLPEITDRKVLANSRIPAIEADKAWMTFATFEFVYLNSHGIKKHVKAVEFLQELQDFLLTDEEKKELHCI